MIRREWILLPLLMLMVGCGDRPAPVASTEDSGVPEVYTTFYPTAYFAERIGGSLVNVVCPVPEDADAIFWMPDADAVLAYQEADLIVLNGAGFAKWTAKVSLPVQRVVDTAKPLADSFLYCKDATVHSHGKGGEHAHEGLDGHTWVDPVNAAVQAEEMLKAMVTRWPEHRQAFESGFAALEKDLDELDACCRKIAEKLDGQPLLASHPAYNYLAKRYNLNIYNLDLDPEEMPSNETFASIKETLKTHPAAVLLWEGAPLPEIEDCFKNELGLKSIEFSPCELISTEDLAQGKDYLSVMKQNLERMDEI